MTTEISFAILQLASGHYLSTVYPENWYDLSVDGQNEFILDNVWEPLENYDAEYIYSCILRAAEVTQKFVDNFDTTLEKYNYNRLRDQKKQKALVDLEACLENLKHKGAKEILIDYSGLDDSGQIDWTEVKPDTVILSDFEKEIIEEFALTHLPPDFEVNDGSQGRICIDLDSLLVEFEHHWNKENRAVFDEDLDSIQLSFNKENTDV